MRNTQNTPSTWRRLALAAGLAVLAAALAGCGSSGKSSAPPTTTVPATTAALPPTTTAPTTTNPAKRSPTDRLIIALAKPPKVSTMPKSLQGAKTQLTPLSEGSRKHHAAAAVVTTNGGALVGYLVFKNRQDALGDLQAFPPNSGPNKVIARSLSGLPQPTYVLRARGNGYVARYVVFVDGPVIVNAWAYGQKGSVAERKLLQIVEENARWARQRLAAAVRTSRS